MNTRSTMNPDRESLMEVAGVKADRVLEAASATASPALSLAAPSRISVAIGVLLRTFWIAR